ncbi:MAG: hypothetical protein HY701_12905 [Gemmatimonadetes bacterium]|nr:hypothetical protein [Gemmatimonadota bacterium]
MNARSVGWRNRLFGWSLMLVGILGGMALGAWVFDGPIPAPARFADYASLPRRLLRFSHIAAMALGMVNILYGHEVDRLRVSERARRVASVSMMLSGVLMPIVLALAAFQIDWKWGLPVPATAAFVALAVLVYGLSQGDAS